MLSININSEETVVAGETSVLSATINGLDVTKTLNMSPGNLLGLFKQLPYEIVITYKNDTVEKFAACRDYLGNTVVLEEQNDWVRTSDGKLVFDSNDVLIRG